jgi:outer membrane protein assembly factor BamB
MSRSSLDATIVDKDNRGLVPSDTVGGGRASVRVVTARVRWNRSHFSLFGVLAVVFLACTGCWSEEGWGPGLGYQNGLEAQLDPGNVGALTLHWSAPPVGTPVGAPAAVAGGVVYQLGNPGPPLQTAPTLYAFDEASGAQLWATPLIAPGGWEPQDRSPAVGNILLGGSGLVFVDFNAPDTVGAVGANAQVLALRTSTGSIAWHAAFAEVSFIGSITLAPTVGLFTGGNAPALLVTATDNNGNSQVLALDPQSGQEFWASPIGTYTTQASVGNGLAYVGGTKDTLYALDLHNGGAIKWTAKVDPKCSGCQLTTSPSVAGNMVVDGAGALQPPMPTLTAWAAFDAASGKLIWRTTQRLESRYPAAVGSGFAFVEDGLRVAAVSLANGTVDWTSPINSVASGPPSLANGVLYVPDFAQLLAMRAGDGQGLSTLTAPAKSSYWSEVAISDGQVFASTDTQGLQVYGL